MIGNFQELAENLRTSGNCAWLPYENRRGMSHFLGPVSPVELAAQPAL
jgi:hypothetical protein